MLREPPIGNWPRKFKSQNRFNVSPGGESPPAHDFCPLDAPLSPPRICRVSPSKRGIRRRPQQLGELTVPMIVVNDDQGPARLEHAPYLGQARIAARRPKIGEPGMHDIYAGIR